MNETTRSALRAFTLAARKLLFSEVEAQLEGVYGFLPDGSFQPAEKYPALVDLPECRETRQRLETLIADEGQAGLKPKEARPKLVKEAAFTWLNRLVALKMMEARRLVKQTVSKGADSNAFKLWVTEPENESHLRDYEAGDLPQDAFGEGPRHRAYRRFLLSECGKLAEEIKVLFDPENLPSRLFPRPQALKELIQQLNAENLSEAWEPGNEETIGWVYQGFIEQEKKEVFDRLYKKKQKVRREDVPAATQIFTPRWIVKWLVENTLGRYWVEMHPDSELATKLNYLVPLAGDIPRPVLKPVREITLLDPACGTMHFGLVAFDLLAEMYREELRRAGNEGWPAEPSVAEETEIPTAILRNNLFGIDIDLRSVQLSALALFLKTKPLDAKAEIREDNLACADVLLLNGAKLDDFVKSVGLERPIYHRILKAFWERARDTSHAGSLQRLEKDIRELVEEEREHYEPGGKRRLPFPELEHLFEGEAGQDEFWELLEIQIRQGLDLFAQQRAAEGADESYFAGEGHKGMGLLDVVMRDYDVVVTNPPYMFRRNMNDHLAGFLQREYPRTKADIYAAFIQRCTEFLRPGGRVGMITQQSFMFISSYEAMRQDLTGRHAVETLCHVGRRAFEEVKGEKVNTTMFVLRREEAAEARENAGGTYFRLVKEPDSEAKRKGFEQALARLKAGEDDPRVFRYRQSDFTDILGSPWVYWIGPGLRKLFKTLPKLSDVAEPRAGMHGGDRFRFARFWWEVGLSNVGRGCTDRDHAFATGKRWFPYMKGGPFRRWYGNQEWVIAFGRAHYRILSEAGNKLPSRQYYFRRGITYSAVSSSAFSARLSPGGFIFDAGGSSLFPRRLELTLACLNSRMAEGFLRLLNPTVNIQAGDIARIPMPSESSELLEHFVKEAIELTKQDCCEDETTYHFEAPPCLRKSIPRPLVRRQNLESLERRISDEVFKLYGIDGEARETIEIELSEVVELDDEESAGEEVGAGLEREVTESFTQGELAGKRLGYALGVVLGRFQPGVECALGKGDFAPEIAARLRDLADPDGVLIHDSGHSDDAAAGVAAALALMLGEESAEEVVRTAAGERGSAEDALRGYLAGPFWKQHIKQYRKRPIYWLFQSPKKKYGVWVFHERMTDDTLFRVQREVAFKVNLLNGQINELRKAAAEASEGRQRRDIEKKTEKIDSVLDDVREFARLLDEAIKSGYRHHIDDGVLLNMAPLWKLFPSWRAEPKKAWQALERGDYDWSHQAMDHWPDRVREKCKTNKSFAIAHGLA